MSRLPLHRGRRRRSLRVVLAMLIMSAGASAVLGQPEAGAASPATPVASSTCKAYDPNLVTGFCMRYTSRSGVAYTWIGTYRASNGADFFCIDYLYDSRISATAPRVSTAQLRNQLGGAIHPNEVAALNYLISTHAPHGSTGTATGNAAIALIIREVMGDGTRGDGTVVYQPGLKIYGTVRPLPGGTGTGIMQTAQRWWTDASKQRGPWSVRLTPMSASTTAPVGKNVDYAVEVVGASGHALPNVGVSVSCTGPITCPSRVTTGSSSARLSLAPRAPGPYTVTANAAGPGGNGQLLLGRWAMHPGTAATNNGVQRGLIAQSVAAGASAHGAATVVKGTPGVSTQAAATANVGEGLTDEVTITDLPTGYDQAVTATLYGPFADKPTEASCASGVVAGTTSVRVRANGTVRTPAITTGKPGYYTWVEQFPGDAVTNPVRTACGADGETTHVRRTPNLVTSASGKQAPGGTSLHDTVTVSGAGPAHTSLQWSLLGPVAPEDGGCAGRAWANAPVAATGEVTVTGDGTYRTADAALSLPGCYTYVDQVAETSELARFATKPGEPTETVLVLDWPALHTVASKAQVTTPADVFDRIMVSGLTTSTLDIEWRLLGPIAPGTHGCAGLDWRGATVRSSGHVRSGNGVVRSPDVSLARPGCYTFAEHAAATSSSAEVDSPPGASEETVMATRPVPRLVPEVPTAPVVARNAGGWWADVLYVAV